MNLPPDIHLEDIEEPWEIPHDVDVTRLCNELQNELASGHELFGTSVVLLAKRIDRDDILISHNSGISVVHLTYSHQETAPFPITRTFSGWNDFVVSELTRDIANWS